MAKKAVGPSKPGQPHPPATILLVSDGGSEQRPGHAGRGRQAGAEGGDPDLDGLARHGRRRRPSERSRSARAGRRSRSCSRSRSTRRRCSAVATAGGGQVLRGATRRASSTRSTRTLRHAARLHASSSARSRSASRSPRSSLMLVGVGALGVLVPEARMSAPGARSSRSSPRSPSPRCPATVAAPRRTSATAFRAASRSQGPWVAVPAHGEARVRAQLPGGQGVVAGTDGLGELARRPRRPSTGFSASPVAFGRTTHSQALFRAVSAHHRPATSSRSSAASRRPRRSRNTIVDRGDAGRAAARPTWRGS